MGHIKEPKNIDLQIEPVNVTIEDKRAISEHIKKLKSGKLKEKSENREKSKTYTE